MPASEVSRLRQNACRYRSLISYIVDQPEPAAPAAPPMPARAQSQAQVKKASSGPRAKAMYEYEVSAVRTGTLYL